VADAIDALYNDLINTEALQGKIREKATSLGKSPAGEARGLGERPQVIPYVGANRVEFRPGAKDEPCVGLWCDVHVRPRQQKVDVVRTGTRGVVGIGTLEFDVSTAHGVEALVTPGGGGELPLQAGADPCDIEHPRHVEDRAEAGRGPSTRDPRRWPARQRSRYR
jgi:hypothetical protein